MEKNERFLELCRFFCSCVFGEPKHGYVPARYVLTFLFFLASVLVYAQKICLSVTIVAMVNHTALLGDDPNDNTTLFGTCSGYAGLNVTLDPTDDGEYLWSPSIQGVILGAYFYGHLISLIISGRLSEVTGGKWTVGLAMFGGSVLTLATPIIADLGAIPFIIQRFLIGLLHGAVLPTAFAMFAHWAPLDEKSTLVSVVMMGCSVGSIIVMPFSAYLIEYGFGGGWPSVYYILGLAGCVWFVFWCALAHSTPTDHPRISDWELDAILEGQSSTQFDQKRKVPWTKIFSSSAFWSLVIDNFCGFWGYATLLTKLPTYLKLVLKFSIQKNGLTNAEIYIASCVTLFASGYLSDFLRTKRKISPTLVRKVFDIFASMGPAVCIALVPQVGCDRNAAIALFTMSMAFYGMIGGGRATITQDMAPHHAATLIGLVSGIGNIGGVVSPLFAGFMLENKHVSLKQWNVIFYVAAGLYIFGGAVFLLFGSSERQPWAMVDIDDKTDLKNEKSENSEIRKQKKYGTIN